MWKGESRTVVRERAGLGSFGKPVMKSTLSSLVSLELYHRPLTDNQPPGQMTQEDVLTPSGIVHDQLLGKLGNTSKKRKICLFIRHHYVTGLF